MHVDGECHCGAIAFSAEIDPGSVRICHCTDCQKLTGTAFRVTVSGNERDLHMLRGAPSIYIKTGDSGRRRQMAFCGNCGSQLWSAPDEPAGARVIGFRSGVLEQRASLVPTQQIYFRSAMPWLPALPGETHDTI